MVKFLTWILLSLLTCSPLYAKANTGLYQIDLIIFTHQSAGYPNTRVMPSYISPDKAQAITLKPRTNSRQTFQLLPQSATHLSQAYWALTHKADYHVLANYSWLQPGNNQKAVIIPTASRDGWDVEGSVQIRRSTYYLLDSALRFSQLDQGNQQAFVMKEHQRLKGGEIYYLDNPIGGMIIRVSAKP